MPREIIKYLCAFKCGKLANSKKSVIEAHETNCLKNPALKTCKSCKHENYYTETEDHPELESNESEQWKVRECGCMSWSVFEDLFISQYPDHNDKTYIPPIKNCPRWESKKS